MSNPSWQTIKELVHNRAGGCCEYCQTCEINIGQAMHVEHINPAGGNHLDNLCLTPTGRATVFRFKMNRPRIVLARKRWMEAGLHPIGLFDV